MTEKETFAVIIATQSMKLKSFATLVENEGNSRSLANQSFNGCGWVGELLFSLFVLAHNPQLFLFYTKP